MTRICVPTSGRGGLDDAVGEHFGRVPTYTLFDTETNDVDVVQNTSEHAGGSGLPAEILANHGMDVLLCRGLGRRAIEMLTERGIGVCIGASGTVRETIDAWKAGALANAGATDGCQQHAFHDHEHGSAHAR
jgi:predicted Fe-Mo cluster-binding NifX family protein